MSLINCTECGAEVSESALDCPKCGHQLKKLKRSFFGKLIKWSFILFNIIMVLWIFGAVSGGGDVVDNAATDAEAAGAALGTAMGTGILMILWLVGDVVLGLFVLFTHPKR
jgi:hypothetical protein